MAYGANSELCYMKCTDKTGLLLRLGLSNGSVIAQWELGTPVGPQAM